MSHHYIEYKNVSYRYPSGKEALTDITFRIEHGEKVALVGKNGAGKSTLLQLMDGLLLPTSGRIDIGGTPLVKKTLKSIRQTVGLVFQNPDDQLFMPTVEEDVAFGPLNMGLPEQDVKERVVKALEDVGCLDLLKSSPMQLSGGQKRRVALATVLSMTPSILVLDEPTSNLDWDAREDVVKIMENFNHTCVVASHDLALIRNICKRALLIVDGKLAADVETEEFFHSEELLSLLGISKKTIDMMTFVNG